MIKTSWVSGNELWAQFCEAHSAAVKAEQDFTLPPRKVKALLAKANKLQLAVKGSPQIMAQLRLLKPEQLSQSELDTLDMLLRVDLDSWEEQPQDLLTATGVSDKSARVLPAFFFAGVDDQINAANLDAGPYAGERMLAIEDQPQRALHRFGGVPTNVVGGEQPEGMFVLQVDLLSMRFEHGWLDGAVEALDESGLPDTGLIQLFIGHENVNNSVDQISVVEASLRYLSEPELLRRTTVDINGFKVPVRAASSAFLPTLQATPAATEQEQAKISEAQNAVERLIAIRSGVPVPHYWFEVAPEWPRMLGLAGGSVQQRHEIQTILATLLPLSHSDRYVLLFSVPLDSCFSEIIPDVERIEIWLRHSDLVARNFDASVAVSVKSKKPAGD